MANTVQVASLMLPQKPGPSFNQRSLPYTLHALRTIEQNTPAWHAARRLFFCGASEVATICGQPRAHKSRAQLWRERKGLADATPSAYVQAMMDNGKDQEVSAARHCAFVLSEKNKCFVQLHTTGIWACEQFAHLFGASVDRIYWADDKTAIPIELKVPSQPGYVPPQERIDMDTFQVLTAIECMRAPYGYLFYYDPSDLDNYTLVKIERNVHIWRNIYCYVRDFEQLCKGDTPPRPLSNAVREQILAQYSPEFDALAYFGHRRRLESARSRGPLQQSVVVDQRRLWRGREHAGGPGPDAKRQRPDSGSPECDSAEADSGGECGRQKEARGGTQEARSEEYSSSEGAGDSGSASL